MCAVLTAVSFAASAPTATRGDNFANVDAIVRDAVASGTIPGAVVLVGHDGQVVYRKAFGMRSLEPGREPMTVDTIFDIASLTKCVVTSTAVMQLVEHGKLRLNDPVAAYLPEFAQNGKQEITIRELLTHFSGLPPDLDRKSPWSGRAAAFQMAMAIAPDSPPGSRFVYSDVNFEVLGFLVEKLSGMGLDAYAEHYIFAPLGMSETRYLPPDDPHTSSWLPRIAPTQYDDQHHMLRGVVHDPTARRMGGVAGHAGVFSTAGDLAKFAEAMLSGSRILSRLSVEKMTTPEQPPTASVLRGLGWDIDSPFSSNRGEFFPVGSFGHTGFTGTSMWIDPVTDSYVIVLTNAVHPNGARTRAVISLRGRIASAVAQDLQLTPTEAQRLRLARITGYNEAMTGARLVTSRNGRVRTGIDVLEADGFAELLGGERSAERHHGGQRKRSDGCGLGGTAHHRCAGRRCRADARHSPGRNLQPRARSQRHAGRGVDCELEGRGDRRAHLQRLWRE
jgi:CubicO group peptidase (beta-lactamase class C family)